MLVVKRLGIAVVMRSIASFAGFIRLSLAVVMRSIVTLVQLRCCDKEYCHLLCLSRGSAYVAVVMRSVAVIVGCHEAQHSRCHANVATFGGRQEAQLSTAPFEEYVVGRTPDKQL